MIERFIPACKDTGVVGAPQEQVEEIVKPTLKEREKLKFETFRLKYSDSLIGNYPRFTESQLQDISLRVISLMNQGSTQALMNYTKNLLGNSFVKLEDIYRVFIFNGYVLNTNEGSLEKIKTKSVSITGSGNRYILIDSEYSSGGATISGGIDNGLPIVIINSGSDFTKSDGEFQNSLLTRFPLFSSFIPNDRHFQSEVMSVARIANEESHVDFDYKYDNDRDREIICMLVGGFIPTVRHANEFLSDVESFKRAGPGFLVQSITYNSPNYTLQSKILTEVFLSFGISPTGYNYEDIHKILEAGNSANEIMSRFIEWEAPIREALKPFEI